MNLFMGFDLPNISTAIPEFTDFLGGVFCMIN